MFEFSHYEALVDIQYPTRFFLVGVRTYRNEERLHHWGGLTYMYRSPEVRTICVYRLEDFEDEDQIELRFHADFPPDPRDGSPQDAWIAPSGDYWLTYPYGHNQLARSLAAIHYADLDGARALERRGWLRVSEGILVSTGNLKDMRITQGQLTTLVELAEMNDDERIRNRLYGFARKMGEQVAS